ncbi:MAG: DUF6817 domain-containing protein [Bacteriovorax sp.]|jgi:hypothetical protein
MNEILNKLSRFNISTTAHGDTTLLAHLTGTYDILKKWECEEYLCLAGLCHSIYGTESFSQTPATLENREYLQSVIGPEAEKLAYYFGAHKKGPFWHNLDRESDYVLDDRFTNEKVSLSRKEFSDLVTMTLANWLEQRPREDVKYHFIRQKEFIDSKPYLSAAAYQDFLLAYGL